MGRERPALLLTCAVAWTSIGFTVIKKAALYSIDALTSVHYGLRHSELFTVIHYMSSLDICERVGVC